MFWQTLLNGFEQFKKALFSFEISDLLDVILVAFVIYSAIKLIRETRAIQLAKGVILLSVVYFLVSVLDMHASQYIMTFIFSNLIIILVVIFSPEIRHALESVGRSSVTSFSFLNFKNRDETALQDAVKNSINSVCKACADMSDKNIGALIVFESEALLGEIAKTGTALDAAVTPELIGNIFFPKAPMHDGAAIIKNGRVVAAGCILPLTSKNNDVSSELGTRHRAAIGMSETSDAVVVVVSEERGAISVAEKGRLTRDISDGDLREILMRHFVKDTESSSKIKRIFRGKNNEKQ